MIAIPLSNRLLAVAERESRRFRLHELDGILEALERLNLNDKTALPCRLVDALSDYGIAVGARSVTELIDCVFDCQAAYRTPFVEPPRRVRRDSRRNRLAASGRMVLCGNAEFAARDEWKVWRGRAQAHIRWVRWHRLHGAERNRARRVLRRATNAAPGAPPAQPAGRS